MRVPSGDQTETWPRQSLQKAAIRFPVRESHTWEQPSVLVETMRAPFFDQFGPRRDDAKKRVLEALAPSLRDSAGNWTADYVRLRVHAVLAAT